MGAHLRKTMDTAQGKQLTKQAIRNKILRELKRQKEAGRERKNRRIKKKLFGTRAFKKAKTVMFYISLVGEVDTKKMIKEAHNLGKIILVPVCCNRNIMACMLDTKAKLKKGPYGVWEPVNRKPVSLKNPGLVVVPGLAFDKRGNRLGRGKGYYDRFLRTIPQDVPSIGLAFDFQVLPFVPSTATDVRVRRVIFA